MPNTRTMRVCDEFAGMTERIKKQLNLNISDPDTTKVIAESLKGMDFSVLGKPVKKEVRIETRLKL